MPIYIRTLGYKIYFWSNENNEPIHFHIAKGNPTENDTFQTDHSKLLIIKEKFIQEICLGFFLQCKVIILTF